MSPCSFENVGSRRKSRDASIITLAARRAARTATASTGSLAAFIARSLAADRFSSGNDKRDAARARALRVARDEAAIDPVFPAPHPIALGPPRRPGGDRMAGAGREERERAPL